MTKEQYELLKAKKPEELTAEEKTNMQAYEAELAAGRQNGNDHMIPKSRLDEEIKKRKDLEDRLSAIEKANKEAEEKRLIDSQKFQELAEQRRVEIESLKPKASLAEEAEKTLKSVLDAQINEMPEQMRGLVPEEMTTQQKLAWLAKNKSLLLKPKAPFNGAGSGTGGGNQNQVELTAEELAIAKKFGMKPEDYANNK